MKKTAAPEISFFKWFMIGLPFSIVFLSITWGYLVLAVARTGSARLLEGGEIIRRSLSFPHPSE